MPLRQAGNEALSTLSLLHNWVASRLPLGQHLASLTLFIGIGNAVGKNIALNRALLTAQGVLPANAAGETMLAAYQQAGLLVQRETDSGPELMPTQRFRELMAEFERWHDANLVPRQHFRRQLHADEIDSAHTELVQQIFDDFFDIDYLHLYGSACALMSSLVAAAAGLKGHRVRIQPCRATIMDESRDATFHLGRAGIKSSPGQVDAHAVCVIDDTVLVDFGLGVARREFSPALPWAVAARMVDGSACLAKAKLPSCHRIEWSADGFGAGIHAELERMAAFSAALVHHYQARCGLRTGA